MPVSSSIHSLHTLQQCLFVRGIFHPQQRRRVQTPIDTAHLPSEFTFICRFGVSQVWMDATLNNASNSFENARQVNPKPQAVALEEMRVLFRLHRFVFVYRS